MADKYDSIIQTKTTVLETEKARRAKQFAEVEATYQKTQDENPFNEQNKTDTRNKHMGRHFSVVRFNYEYDKAWANYNRQAQKTRQSSMAELRLEHYTKDEFPFVSAGALQRDAGQLLGDIARGKGMGYRNISAKGRYQVELVMAKRSLLAGGNEKQYFETVKKTQQKYGRYQQQQSDMRSAQARAKVAGYLKADSEHWASVANNPATSQKGGSTSITSKQSSNQLNKTGKSNFPEINYRDDGRIIIPHLPKVGENFYTYNGKVYKKYLKAYEEKLEKEQPLGIKQYNSNPMLQGTGTLDVKKGTSHYTSGQVNSKDYQAQVNAYASNVQKQQRVTEIANEKQSAYTDNLRAGNIKIAEALLNPQTTQKYYGTDTRNLKTFLKERGYDLSKPDSIPNSVFTTPVKYTEARSMGSGDLRTAIPEYQSVPSLSGKQRISNLETLYRKSMSDEDAKKKAKETVNWQGITVPPMPSNPLVAPPPKAKPVTQKKKSEPVTKWTFNQQGFNDKSKLDAYVQSRYDQAKSQTALTTIQNIQPNKTGNLNPVGFFQTGDYGTDGNFGALDVVGLFVILISMVGFNRLSPIVGVLLSASIVFALSFFGIISLPTVLVGVIALVIFLGWGITRNR